MAYQTGTSSGISDLLDKAGIFVAANGGTQHRRDSNSLSISLGNVFQNYFDNGAGEIWMSGAAGFNAGSAWNAQPGAGSPVQKSRQMSGSFSAYHFFLDVDYFHIVVEVDPGLYRHLVAGELAKSSNYAGGQYSAAIGFKTDGTWVSSLFCSDRQSSDSTYLEASSIRAEVDGVDSWKRFSIWPYFDSSDVRAASSDFKNLSSFSSTRLAIFSQYYDWFQYCYENTLNGITALIPIHVYVDRPGDKVSPIGYVKDLRMINMKNFNPGQAKVYGANEWLLFPCSVKSSSGLYATGNLGYAYKKIP